LVISPESADFAVTALGGKAEQWVRAARLNVRQGNLKAPVQTGVNQN